MYMDAPLSACLCQPGAGPITGASNRNGLYHAMA